MNHSIIYSVALYSEQTFNFLTFLGLYIFYYNVEPKNISFSVKSHSIITSTIVFGISTLCRSTGILMTFFIVVVFAKKLVTKSDRFFKIYKYIFYALCCTLIMILPIGVVMLWKPYVMHCETKLDRTNAVPSWCLEEFPNVYNYI